MCVNERRVSDIVRDTDGVERYGAPVGWRKAIPLEMNPCRATAILAPVRPRSRGLVA